MNGTPEAGKRAAQGTRWGGSRSPAAERCERGGSSAEPGVAPTSGFRVPRSRGRRASPRPASAAVLLALASGCGGLASRPFDEEAPPAQRARKFLLEYRREVGLPDRHTARYVYTFSESAGGRKARGAPRYMARDEGGRSVTETVTTEIGYWTTGRDAIKVPDSAEPVDRVVVLYADVERERVAGYDERAEKDLRFGQPVVTPNVGPEPGSQYVFMAVSRRGRIALRKETPYHYVWRESLCYALPVFPDSPVGIGDRWQNTYPAVMGRVPSEAVLKVKYSYELRDLRIARTRSGKGVLCAVIGYSYGGLLDAPSVTTEGSARPLPLGEARHTVEGQGTVHFAVEEGKILWREEDYTARTSSRIVPGSPAARERGITTPVTQETTARVRFASRLISPDERASGRPDRLE